MISTGARAFRSQADRVQRLLPEHHRDEDDFGSQRNVTYIRPKQIQVKKLFQIIDLVSILQNSDLNYATYTPYTPPHTYLVGVIFFNKNGAMIGENACEDFIDRL